MTPRPRVLLTRLAGAVVLIATLAAAGGGRVQAQGRLDAAYVVTLGGVPVGKGSWNIDVQDDQFTATATGATSGLLRVFASGSGNSVAHGSISGGQPVSSTYASTIVADNHADQVRILFNGGAVKDYLADPPTLPNPDRVPLTDLNRKGVLDPMTASLIRVAGNGDTFVPDACQRTLPVFDGRMRYDLQLVYKHLDKVKSERGYQGTVVVCAVYFAPIAGHIPERSTIKYLVAQRDMELWLAPIAGTRLMVPYRASVPTPIGLGVMQAKEFVSIPRPPLPTASNLKMQ
ncbi:MAG: hypothetical protein QOI40_1750 [Alphaproteobacteria bacterium]|nr:hypothetical protein [Alphaproteobacteria bacterium]